MPEDDFEVLEYYNIRVGDLKPIADYYDQSKTVLDRDQISILYDFVARNSKAPVEISTDTIDEEGEVSYTTIHMSVKALDAFIEMLIDFRSNACP